MFIFRQSFIVAIVLACVGGIIAIGYACCGRRNRAGYSPIQHS